MEKRREEKRRINTTVFLWMLLALVVQGMAQKSLEPCPSEESAFSNESEQILRKYIELSELSMQERPRQFDLLNARGKASVIKLHLAYQLGSRSNLTSIRTLLSEALASTSAHGY